MGVLDPKWNGLIHLMCFRARTCLFNLDTVLVYRCNMCVCIFQEVHLSLLQWYLYTRFPKVGAMIEWYELSLTSIADFHYDSATLTSERSSQNQMTSAADGCSRSQCTREHRFLRFMCEHLGCVTAHSDRRGSHKVSAFVRRNPAPQQFLLSRSSTILV